MPARANRTTRAKAAARATSAAQARAAALAESAGSTGTTRTRPAKQAPAKKAPVKEAPVKGATPGRPPFAGLAAGPKALRMAAAAQALEALGLVVAGVFAVVSTAQGHSSTRANGLGLTVLVFITAALLAAFAVGLARVRPWSRVPAVMTQLVVIVAGAVLLDGHRPEWGVPALVLAVVCLAGVLTPASLRALNRSPDELPFRD